jgi:TonB family protein
MATREEFGKYLLLKKLTEDPLGETFRAGRVGAQGMEQVVLLRALNGPRLDTARLVEGLPARAPIQEGLKSPNIGNGVDLGDVKGVPFIAYDYISGKNLATLLAEAESQASPIALDHALLIAERIAQALAVAFETRLADQRLLHGFVVPPLVRVSNEGETRLLGFEVGPVLQEMAGRGIFEPTISAYLAPEVLAGEPAAKSDDIYSLGALLFQLLTGKPPTASDPTGLVQEIDRGQVAPEEGPIPAPLATLLKKSLTPRDNRIPEAVSWHKALTKIMVEGQYNATTFNLAFFMHNLFRTEIERESQELEEEKQIKADEKVGPPPMPEAVPAESEAAFESTGTHASYTAGRSEGGPRTGLWIGLAAVLLLALAGGWYFLMGPGVDLLPGSGSEVETTPETATQPAIPEPEPENLPTSPLDETANTENAEAEAARAEQEAEELQTQIQKMIADSNQDLEAKFKAQYESKIQELQKQLAETQAAAERAREEAQRREQTPAATETSSPTEEATDETRLAAAAPTGPEAANAATTEAAEADTARTGGETRSEPTESATGDLSQRQAADQQSAQQPSAVRRPERPAGEPSSRAPQPTTPPEPAQVTPPEIVRQPQAHYPQIARRMGRQATVLLRVLVDETGQVTEVERIGKRVGSGFDEAAVQAARQARYKPGTEDGAPKAMWTTLRIEFRPPS